MLFAFRKENQCASNAVGGGLALYLGVYNSRGYFGVTRFTSPCNACERSRFGMSEGLVYGDPKGRNGSLFVLTTCEQDPRAGRRPVAHRAHALIQRFTESAKGESGARMRPENSQRGTLWTRTRAESHSLTARSSSDHAVAPSRAGALGRVGKV